MDQDIGATVERHEREGGRSEAPRTRRIVKLRATIVHRSTERVKRPVKLFDWIVSGPQCAGR